MYSKCNLLGASQTTMSMYGPGQERMHLTEIMVLNETVSELRTENGNLKHQLDILRFEFDKLKANPEYLSRLRSDIAQSEENLLIVQAKEFEATKKLINLFERIEKQQGRKKKLETAIEVLGKEGGRLMYEDMAQRNRKNWWRGALWGVASGVISSFLAAGLLRIDPAQYLPWSEGDLSLPPDDTAASSN